MAHLTGFANAVRICQKDYFGPLIVVLPPIRALFGDTQQSYSEKVTYMTRLHHQGHAIESALGVPCTSDGVHDALPIWAGMRSMGTPSADPMA